MQGIVMAGGSGTRLAPLTKVVNKHLLPIYDKPLIYFPISTLMLTGIRNILIVSNSESLFVLKKLLGSGSDFGVNFDYAVQDEPRGIADGLIVGKEFINGKKVCLILGDNIFHGPGLGRSFKQYRDVNGAQLFAYQVSDPQNYGIADFDLDGKLIAIEEKPSKPKSSYAITGIYFYDEQASELASNLKPSARGELEITDLNKAYLALGQVKIEVLSRGAAWLDTGTYQGLHNAATYIRILQERQNLVVADLKQIAHTQGWI
jgi:glucose-1-phosphate thymidylyltransferase